MSLDLTLTQIIYQPVAVIKKTYNVCHLICRELNRRILELESQVEELLERGEGGGSEVRQRIGDLQEQLRAMHLEKEKKQALLEERDVAVVEYSTYLPC